MTTGHNKALACGAILLGVLLSATAYAAQPKTDDEIALWPGVAPGSVGVNLVEKSTDSSKDPNDQQRTLEGITKPTIRAFIPAKPNGAAAVITVGGGYTSLVIDKEGTDIAKWL